MKKGAEHSRRPGSNGQGKNGKGWRSHPRRSVPADCIGSTTTATADHARPGTVSGPAADHRRMATTTGTEGQRTGSGPGSRRLSSGCTMAAWAVVAFTTQKGGNCCHNCLLWQQLGHLQQFFGAPWLPPAVPGGPIPDDRRTLQQFQPGPLGWGVVYSSRPKSSTKHPLNSPSPTHVHTPRLILLAHRGGSLENRGQKRKSQKGVKKNFYKNASLMWGIRT